MIATHFAVAAIAAPPASSPGRQVATHCPHCALGCGMTLREMTAPVRVQVLPRDFPTNRGALCPTGWASAESLDRADRLTTPLLRDRPGRRPRPATWEEALAVVVARITRIQREYGRDAVAVCGDGALTTEQAYALDRFAGTVLHTTNVDAGARLPGPADAAPGRRTSEVERALGVDRGLPFPLADVAAADTLLLVGTDVAETMPPFGRHLAEQRQRGGTQIVIDARATATARQATRHLRPVPGTELAVANALLHIVIAEGWLDQRYVATRTTGFDEVCRSIARYRPAHVEHLSGVPVAELVATAHALATADRAVILTGDRAATGEDTVTAFINLALTLGLPGRPGCGYGRIAGDGGGPGPSASELLNSGQVHGLLDFGSDPATDPRTAESLRELDLLVVAGPARSQTAELADVVLPTAQWAEEEGTMTNLEGRVLRRRALRRPPPGVRTDLAVLAELASQLGSGVRFMAEPRAVFEELRRASAGGTVDYAGVTWERVDAEDGVFWPCPSVDRPGTPRLFVEDFPTPDGRARLVATEHSSDAEELSAGPVPMATGRALAHHQSGAGRAAG